MHPIPVRKMTFEIPSAAQFDPRWVADNIILSYVTTGISLYVAYLEPFLVKSLRQVLPRIADATLKENVDRFCRQEAQHYRQHERFNEAIVAQGYPGLEERLERLRGDFDAFLATRSEKWCVGFVEGFEAYTTQAALRSLERRIYDHPRTDRRFGSLFKWHMTEEIEHREVAFDVYEHLYGDYPFRVRLCVVAQAHIWRFVLDCMKIMSPVDAARFGDDYRVSSAQRFLAGGVVLPMFVKTWMPWYTPHRYVVPEGIERLSAQLSAAADSVT